ncbi:hypothetical protein [Campylobacter concisus]|uniref:hypothetical protein n=1 Tax=Campylobacter concisus TaxID=199 RepID=UPI002156477F|nr:hypothetical protein [Campylobacter concisus]
MFAGVFVGQVFKKNGYILPESETTAKAIGFLPPIIAIIVCASITNFAPYAVVTLISTLFTLNFSLKSLTEFGCFCRFAYKF